MCLETIVYSGPLKEDQNNTKGWDKSTIDYVQKYKSRICGSIRSIAASKAKLLQTADIEDIYCELIMYLYKCDDYNIAKAYERSNSDGLVPLEGYVFSLTKYCVFRYISNMYEREKMEVNIVKNEGDSEKEWSIYDTISDESAVETYESKLCSITDICEESVGDRYRIGADIYLIIYVKLLTSYLHKKEAYKYMLNLLGVPENVRNTREDNSSLMLEFVKAISVSGEEESIREVGRFVYQRELIDKAIAAF